MDFDGLDDSVEIASGPGAFANHTALTMSGWVYPRTADAAAPNYEGYFGVRNNSDADFYLIQEGTNIRGVFTNSASDSYSVSTSATVNDWQHLALVYDGSNLSLFKNGVLADQIPATGQIINSTGMMSIGKIVDGTNQYYLDGQVDEVQVWSTALTEQFIREGMGESLVGNETGLELYYRFDQHNSATQTILYDITGNDQDGVLVSMDPNSDWVGSTAFNTWLGADSSDWLAAGNWSRNNQPSTDETVGIYAGDFVHQPILGTAVDVNNLVVGSNAVLAVDSLGSGSVNASGNLFNYGAIVQSQIVNAAPATFMSTGGYGGVIIDPGTVDLGQVSVTFRDYQDCVSGGGTVERCFNITSTNAPTNATVTFFHDSSELNGNDCLTLGVYHYSGSWTSVTLDGTYGTGGRDCTTSPYSIRATGINTFSPFVLKSNGSPTAVTLEKFEAKSVGNMLPFAIALGVPLTLLAFLMYVRWRRQAR